MMGSMRPLLVVALIIGLSGAAAAQEKKRRLLVIGQAKGYQHESISTATEGSRYATEVVRMQPGTVSAASRREMAAHAPCIGKSIGSIDSD